MFINPRLRKKATRKTLQQGSYQRIGQNAGYGNSPYPDWNIDMLITLFTPILTQPAEKPVTERSAYKAHKSTYQQVAGIMYSQVRTGIARYHRP